MARFARASYRIKHRALSMLLGDRLCLSDEPLESFLAALCLQFLPNHIPAGLVVAVEPVTLQGKKEGHHAVRNCTATSEKPR